MSQTNCPSCNGVVSPKAFDCPHCGHPIRKPKRGFFGVLFKWMLIVFNMAMLAWLFTYLAQIGEIMEGAGSEAEQAGAALGGTMGVGFLLVTWVLGDIILGLATLLTRPRK